MQHEFDLRIERGNPTDEEIAALTVVLLALQGPVDADPPQPARVRWIAPAPAYGVAHSWRSVA